MIQFQLEHFLKNHTNFIRNWKGHDRWPYDKKTLESVAEKMFKGNNIKLFHILVYLEYTIKLKEGSNITDEVWLKDVSSILEIYTIQQSKFYENFGALSFCGLSIILLYYFIMQTQ